MRSLATDILRKRSLHDVLKRSYSIFSNITIDYSTKRKFIESTQDNTIDPYKNFLSAREQSTDILKTIIPIADQDILKNFGKHGRPLILLENCPIVGDAGLPPTPDSSTQPQDKDRISEMFILGMSGLLEAKPYVMEGVRDGTVINQVIPLAPDSISGSGSKKEFNFHNEVVHENHVPDLFILLCLRGNPMAKTGFCLLEDIVSFLPPQILEELQKPNFIMKSGDKSVFNEYKELISPILTKDKSGRLSIRLNLAPNRCEATTADAKIALNYISDCISSKVPVHEVSLSGGQGVVILDRKLLHKRSPFDASETGDKKDNRWLQRMNLSRDNDSKSR